MIKRSIMFSGVFRMGASGPSVFRISFRVFVSVLFIAPVSIAVIM